MDKTKVFFTSLLLSSSVSGVANAAAITATSATALSDLRAASSTDVDTSWIRSGTGWAGIDSNVDAKGIAWDVAGSLDPCDDNWAGIVCDASGNISHLEIPNSNMTGTLEGVFAALAPIKANLVSINLSGTVDGEESALSGSIPGTSDGTGYTALKYLALNNVGATGTIPDLSSYTALTLANLYDNDFTTYTGPVGDAGLTSLRLYGNANLSGDLAATFTQAPNLGVLRSEGTQLTGGLEVVTDVTLGAGVTAKTMVISWTPAANGASVASHTIEYTSDGGSTWTATDVVVATGNSFTTGVLANGTYGSKVTPKTSSGTIGTPSYTTVSLVIDDSGTTSGTGSGTENESGGGTTTSGGTTESSGGGAVFWILALPLLGFARRPR